MSAPEHPGADQSVGDDEFASVGEPETVLSLGRADPDRGASVGVDSKRNGVAGGGPGGVGENAGSGREEEEVAPGGDSGGFRAVSGKTRISEKKGEVSSGKKKRTFI